MNKEESSLKKIICLLLVLSIFAVTTVTADSMMGTGATVAGVGLGFIFLPMVLDDPSLATQAGCYIGGGACVALGLILTAWGAMRGESYAMLDNPILDIVSFGTDGQKTFIGAKFSFR